MDTQRKKKLKKTRSRYRVIGTSRKRKEKTSKSVRLLAAQR
jgi:hypothetical protein